MSLMPPARFLKLIASWVAVSLGVLPAQVIPIVNPGFEADAIVDGAFVVLQPSSWVNYDPAGIINNVDNAVGVIRPNLGGEYFPSGAPEGVNAALVFLAGNQTAEAGLQQTLNATLQANTRYRGAVQIGNIASGTSLPGSSGGAGNFFNLNGFPGYRIEVLAGTNVVGSDNNSIGGAIPEGLFRQVRFYFDITNSHPQLGQALTIRLINLKQPGSPSAPNIEVDFDAVQLAAGPIPVAAELSLNLVGSESKLTIVGTTAATYRIETSAAIPSPNWLALTNLVMTTEQATVDVGFDPGESSRYYRAVLVE